MKPTVFIHTNDKQMVGAILGRHSLKRNLTKPDAFEVQITHREDFPFFDEFERDLDAPQPCAPRCDRRDGSPRLSMP